MSEDNEIIQALKKVTFIVKVYPFFYAFLFIFAVVPQIWISYEQSIWIDYMTYLSPCAIVLLVLLSYPLKFCNWHRLQCCLPLLPFISVVIDNLVSPLSKAITYINYGTVITMFALSLVNAYFVFVKPKTK